MLGPLDEKELRAAFVLPQDHGDRGPRRVVLGHMRLRGVPLGECFEDSVERAHHRNLGPPGAFVILREQTWSRARAESR